MTLACEDDNSKLVDVVTVADEDRVVNNLLQISKLRFGKNAKLLFRLWAQGLVKILKLELQGRFSGPIKMIVLENAVAIKLKVQLNLVFMFSCFFRQQKFIAGSPIFVVIFLYEKI